MRLTGSCSLYTDVFPRDLCRVECLTPPPLMRVTVPWWWWLKRWGSESFIWWHLNFTEREERRKDEQILALRAAMWDGCVTDASGTLQVFWVVAPYWNNPKDCRFESRTNEICGERWSVDILVAGAGGTEVMLTFVLASGLFSRVVPPEAGPGNWGCGPSVFTPSVL